MFHFWNTKHINSGHAHRCSVAVLLVAAVLFSVADAVTECNYTSLVMDRSPSSGSPLIVSNCLFNQTIDFQSTINATLAVQPVAVRFLNVTFGVLGNPSGPALNAVPDFSSFAFESDCVVNSVIALNGRMSAELKNVSLYVSNVMFLKYGKLVVSAAVGISGAVLDVRGVGATIVGDSRQLWNGLFHLESPLIASVHVTFADIVGSAVLGSALTEGGKFVALLKVDTNLLTNTLIHARRVAWNTSGVCRESKVIALNAVSLQGPTTVSMDNITWNTVTFVYFATATTANALVAYGSNAVSGPLVIELKNVNAFVRSEDPSAVRPAVATVSTGVVSLVRGDRTSSNIAAILLSGSVNITINDATVTAHSAIRLTIVDLEFCTGPTLHLSLRVTSVRAFLVVGGPSVPVTLQNVDAFVAGLMQTNSNIHREGSLLSLAGLSICASATIVMQHVTYEVAVYVNADTDASLLQLNPWMFTVVNLLSLSNTTSLELTLTDSSVSVAAASSKGALPELCIVHGVIASVFQFIATNAMKNCTISLTNVNVTFIANITVAAWQPASQGLVAPFLGANVNPASLGVLAVTFATILMDVVCCDAGGGDRSGGLHVTLVNVSTILSLSEATTSVSRSSGGGVWVSVIASGSVGKRAVLSGITIPLVADALQEKFGTPMNRVNVLRNALITVKGSRLVLDVPSTAWVDSILAAGSDAAPFTGTPPAGRKSSFGGFLFFGGSSFVPTGVPRKLAAQPSATATTAGQSNASSVVWIEGCTLLLFRSSAPSTSVSCATNVAEPGQPSAALLSIRWTTFQQVNGFAPTLVAVTNVTMSAVDGTSGVEATMTLALLHTDYSAVALSPNIPTASQQYDAVGAEFLFSGVVMRRPGVTPSISSCRAASASLQPLDAGWQALRFGYQSLGDLFPTRIVLRNVHILQPRENITELRVFSSPLNWKPVTLIDPSSIAVQCCSIDYVRPISVTLLAAPRWLVKAIFLPTEGDNAAPCLHDGLWTRTPTPDAPPAPAPVAPTATTRTAVGSTLIIVTAVVSIAGVGATAGTAVAASTSAMRLQTASAAVAMSARCSVAQGSDSSAAADAIATSVSDNPTQAAIASFDSWTSAAGGALLANIALIAAFAVSGPLFGLGISKLWNSREDRSNKRLYLLPSPLTWRNAVAFLVSLVPGQGTSIYSTLLQPTFSAAIALLQVDSYPLAEQENGGGNGRQIALGVAGLLFLVLSAGGVVWSVYRAERTGNLRGVDPPPLREERRNSQAPAVSWRDWFVATEWKYTCAYRATMGDDRIHREDDAAAFERQFSSAYSGYRRACLWFLGCEWVVALACGLLSAVSTLPSVLGSPATCAGLIWAVAAVSILLVLGVVFLRPYGSKFDNVNNIVQTTSTATVVILAAALPPDNDDASNAANIVLILQTVLLTLGVVIDIGQDLLHGSGACIWSSQFQNSATHRQPSRQPSRTITPRWSRSNILSVERSLQGGQVETSALRRRVPRHQERLLHELLTIICREKGGDRDCAGNAAVRRCD
jgi:hypothetical protein